VRQNIGTQDNGVGNHNINLSYGNSIRVIVGGVVDAVATVVLLQ
jgi:hypothetical protein